MALLEEKMDKALLEEAETIIQPILRKDEKLLYQAFSDITEDGLYGHRWLFITNQRVIVVTPEKSSKVEADFQSI